AARPRAASSSMAPIRSAAFPACRAGSRRSRRSARAVLLAKMARSPDIGWASPCDVHQGKSMPDAIELLKTRRSMKPREMTGPGPTPAEIETILTIGARVPDHGKLAPWRFILFEGDGRGRAGEIIANVFAKKNPQASSADIEIEKKRLTDAPLVIGIVS